MTDKIGEPVAAWETERSQLVAELGRMREEMSRRTPADWCDVAVLKQLDQQIVRFEVLQRLAL